MTVRCTKPRDQKPEELPLSTRLARVVIALLATLYLPVVIPLFRFLDIALNVDPKQRLTIKQVFEWWSSWLLMKK